jgi:hypothetical protein
VWFQKTKKEEEAEAAAGKSERYRTYKFLGLVYILTMEQNKYPTHSYSINNYTLFERVSFNRSNFKFIFINY